MRFHGTVQCTRPNTTGIAVPDELVSGLGLGSRPPVLATVAGHTYRSTLGRLGGRFVLPLSAEHRRGAGVSAGDVVEVEIVPDTEPREVDVPADLTEALAEDQSALDYFDALSYSHRLAYVSWIRGAKRPDTRQRRIVEAIGMLRAGLARH